MLDTTTIRDELDTAIEAFSNTLVDLYCDEVDRQRAAAAANHIENGKLTVEARSPVHKGPKPKSAPQKKTTAIPASTLAKPLLSRPNVHRVPSKPKPVTTSLYEPRVRKGPSPEEIALKAERIVMAASLPPTFERLRRALRVTKVALAPVIDQLVSANKICVVDVGGVILYKPPRIEPIRRRRGDRHASQRR